LTDSAREAVPENEAPKRRRLKWAPRTSERDWPSKVASAILHVVVILLIILPSLTQVIDIPEDEGAGGAGPAGGGGGGNRGTGGVRSERIQYVAATPTVVPPVVEPPRIIPPLVEVKKPEVVPPPVVPTPPVVETAKVDSNANKAAEATSVVAGAGGGSGNDGTNGSGPGKGGGKGSGEGTGTGSSVGPGTGGGTGTVYPPQVTQLVILPLPAPNKVKPYEMTAVFDVDSLGHAELLTWNRPKDSDYARKVEATLKGYRFRPAVRAIDGMPVRDTVAIRASVGK
jgi:periplasmic protein TonB